MAQVTTPTQNGSEFLIKGGIGDQKNVVMAALKDGSYVATWTVDNGIMGQHFAADGSKVGLEFMVSKVGTGQSGQKISVLDDGSFIVLWGVEVWGGGDDVLIQRFDSNVSKVGSIFSANVEKDIDFYTDTFGVTSLKNGGFIVNWYASSGYGSIKAQKYDANGKNEGNVINLGNVGHYENHIITLENGNLVFSIQNSISILNSNGKAIGDSFSMNTYNSGIASPTMSALKDGGFIAAWETDKQDGDSRGIFAQRFDASGNTVGTEFQVNTYTTGAQQKPNIVSLSDGGFLITWQSWAQEPDPQDNGRKGNGIFGQRYGSDNLPVGKEFQINTTTDDNQDTPNVIALTDGTVVVAWQSDNQNGAKDYDIYAQRLDTGAPKAVVDKPTTTDTPKTDGSNTTSNQIPSSTSFEGTSKNDALQGNDSNNTLLGLAGNDVLNGGAGDDIIKGGAGNDTLIGGLGADVLIGGSGADVFRFTSLNELGNTEETADVIVDFNTKQKDKIDLSGIDANEDKSGDQAFTLVKGFSDTDATGQLFFDAKTQMIYGSTNADSDPEFVIMLNGVTSLKAADFVL